MIKHYSGLKPCPFCGNTVALGVYDSNEESYVSADEPGFVSNPYYHVVCSVNENSPIPIPNWENGCGGSSGFHPTPEEAIAAWNTRKKEEE